MSQPVRAVERALDILSCFLKDEPTLSLTQIAERVGMHKSTVHRLLSTLEGKRFVYRDKSTGMYHLGFRFLEMTSLVSGDTDIERWALPYLERLVAEFGETVDLATLDGPDVVYLQVVESHQRVRLAAAPGSRLPAFCTASGKAFMAYLSAEEVHAILDTGLDKFTENTIVSLPEMYQDLRVTRERGFAISEQEYEAGINAVAAPILDANGCPVATIAITGPSFRLARERMLALGPSIRATADAIAREIGMVALSAIVAQTAIPGIAEHPDQRG